MSKENVHAYLNITTPIDHKRLVGNNNTNPDVFFNFGDEKSQICAHHCIIKARCPQMLEGGTIKRKQGQVISFGKDRIIPNHPAAMRRVLNYLYAGEIDLASYSPNTAIEVLHVALQYNIIHLIQVTKKFIKDQLTTDNIFHIIKYAHDLKVEPAKVICIDFALENTVFFGAKAVKEIGFDLYQEVTLELVYRYKNGKPSRTEDCTINTTDPIVDNFKSLYHSTKDQGDTSISVGGKLAKVHRCILSAQSPQLDELIQSENVEVPSKYRRVTVDAWNAMLRYYYFNQTDMDIFYVCQLIEFAQCYKLTGLIKVLEQNIADNAITAESAPFALEVAYTLLPHNEKLRLEFKKKGIIFTVKHLERIDFAPLESMPQQIGADLIIEVQKVMKGKWDPKQISLEENLPTGKHSEENSPTERTYTERNKSARGKKDKKGKEKKDKKK